MMLAGVAQSVCADTAVLVRCCAPYARDGVVVRHNNRVLGTNDIALSARQVQALTGRAGGTLVFDQRWQFMRGGEPLALRADVLAQSAPVSEYHLLLERPADMATAEAIQRRVYFANFDLAAARVPPLDDGVACALPRVWNGCLTRNATWQQCVDAMLTQFWRNLPESAQKVRRAWYAAPQMAVLGRARQTFNVADAYRMAPPTLTWSSAPRDNSEWTPAMAHTVESADVSAAPFGMLYSTNALVRIHGVNLLMQQPALLAALAGPVTALDSCDVLHRAAPALPPLRAAARAPGHEQPLVQAYAVLLAANPAQMLPDDTAIIHWLLNTWYGPHCFAALATLDRDDVWHSALRASIAPVSKDATPGFPEWCLFAPRGYAATNVLAVCRRIHDKVLAIDAQARKTDWLCWYLNVLARVPQPDAIVLALDALRRSRRADTGVRSIAGSDGVQRAAVMHAVARDAALRARIGNDTLADLMRRAPYVDVLLDLKSLEATPRVTAAIAQLSTELHDVRAAASFRPR
jgi:hypothetical protein